MHPSRTLVAVGAIALAHVPAAGAQLSRELRPGRMVRIVAPERFFEGRVQSTARDTVTLDLGGTLRPVALADVERAYVRGRATGRGALIGGVTGALVLGTLGVLAVGGLCESPSGCHGDYPTAALFGGGIGFAGGAVLGAGVGALTFHWRRVR